MTLRLKGQLALARGDHATAGEAFAASMSLAEHAQNRVQQGVTDLAVADLQAALGDLVGARAHVSAAREHFAAIENRHWLEVAARAARERGAVA